MKKFFILRISAAFLILTFISLFTFAQSGRNKPATTDTNSTKVSDDEVVKVDTDLVLVPVIVSDRNYIYTADMKKEEFEIYEDGEKQEIVFFGTITEPFHVVLMLDTSGSTKENLAQIQEAAYSFIKQLQANDRVKIISFDDRVHELSAFTSNQTQLRDAIYLTQPGTATKFYDAMEIALNAFQNVQGRKAVVIFTDGVDSYNDKLKASDIIESLKEAGIIVYPIRYDTKEYLIKSQVANIHQSFHRAFDPNAIAVTFHNSFHQMIKSNSEPLIIVNGKRFVPKPRPNQNITTVSIQTSLPSGTGVAYRKNRNSLEQIFNIQYSIADMYLENLAKVSGGQLYRADTLGELPNAFSKIADELRTQYALGYYPSKKIRDGKFRKLTVKTTRKNVVIRAKPGYTLPKEN